MDSHRLPTIAELDAFVATAKAGGVPDAALVPLLKQNGWSERRVYRSLSGWYAQALGVPPPSRIGAPDSPREGLYYLLTFITLGFWTVALGQIAYMLIARAFPDRGLAPNDGLLFPQIAWQVATVMVTFPVFAFVSRLVDAELRRRPDAADSGVRRWLTSIALVIAAVIVLGDGIWFLGSFLRGELTVRFVLDSLVLLVLGGGVFAYYLVTMRPERYGAR